MTNLRAQIEPKISSAFIQYALFRWESATMLAGTLLLTFLLSQPFPWWPVWAWPVLGSLGLAGIIYSSLTDDETYGKVVWQLVCEKLDLKLIEDAPLRQQVSAALDYQKRIESEAFRQRQNPDLYGHLTALTERFAAWMEQLYRLARYQDTYSRDYRLQELRQRLPQEIETLVSRRKFEKNPQIQQRLDTAMEDLGRSWQTLRALDAEMQQGTARLEQQLADLKRFFGEVQQLAQQVSLVGGIGDRLQNDVQEQIDRLTGAVEHIDQLYTAALGASK